MFKRIVSCLIVCAFAGASAAALAQAHGPGDGKIQFERLIAEAKKAMMGDPNAALASATKAEKWTMTQPRSHGQQEALATALWLEGEALTRVNDVDKARLLLARAERIASGDGKVTRLDGDLALSLARAADRAGDQASALKGYQKAQDVFAQLGEARGQSLALEGLGSIHGRARDFAREIEYYQKASQVYSKEPALELTVANNVGFALQQMGRYEEAVKDFRKALGIAVAMDSPVLQARILTNLAAAHARHGKLQAASKAADRALALLKKVDDHGWLPFVWGIKAEIAYDRGALHDAAGYLKKAFEGQDLSKTIAPFRDMHKVAYEVYRALGEYPKALAHLEAFKRLDDDGRSLAASANLALMNAKFDFANQKLEIEHLKSEQLRREASLRRSRVATQRVIMLAVLVVGAMLLGWVTWRHRVLRKHRDAISKANTELMQSLHERDQEIERRIEVESRLRLAKEVAEQASHAKTHFLANMSHELRTPLNAIIGFADILAMGVMPAEKAVEYAADISSSGHKLLEILNSTLDMADLDAGHVALTESEVGLGDIVDIAVTRLGKEMDLEQRQIHVSGDRRLRIRADAFRISQALENLLSNAAKFTAADGNIAIAVGRNAAGEIEISVSDDGVGIPRSQIARVIEPFGQVESAYVRSHGGIGLGLPIVKALVELHGGSLVILSELDHGTIVRIRLPAERVLDSTHVGTAHAC